MVYYGQRYETGTANPLTTIEAMQQYTTFNQSSTTSLPCTNAQFGDPAAAEEKQCMCELSTVTAEKRVAALGSDNKIYQCDDWNVDHAVRCCAEL